MSRPYRKADGAWQFPEWSVEDVPHKHGKGVRAGPAGVPAGVFVPYSGELIAHKEWQLRSHEKAGTAWAIRLPDDTYVDGNPAREPPGDAGAWLGSRANEPSPDEFCNAKCWTLRVTDIPEVVGYYPTLDLSRGYVVMLETMCDIPPGEELLWDYGASYSKQRGYKRSAAKAAGWGALDAGERRLAKAELAAALAEAQVAAAAAAAARALVATPAEVTRRARSGKAVKRAATAARRERIVARTKARQAARREGAEGRG
jgi:hypothetical protein